MGCSESKQEEEEEPLQGSKSKSSAGYQAYIEIENDRLTTDAIRKAWNWEGRKQRTKSADKQIRHIVDLEIVTYVLKHWVGVLSNSLPLLVLVPVQPLMTPLNAGQGRTHGQTHRECV
jgi:hypothetical protein